jgi:hypothetical protein
MEDILKGDCFVRISYDRFGVLLRDELIASAAAERWNVPSGEVVKALLTCALDEDSRLSDTRNLHTVSISEIIDKLPKDPANALLYTTGIISKGGEKWGKNLMDLTRAYMNVLSGKDAVGDTSKARFTNQDSVGDKGYYVEIEQVAARMRASLLDSLVRERLGANAAKVLACFAGGKKMLESGVSSLSPSMK